MKNNKKWTPNEIEFLKKNYNILGPTKCATTLERSIRSIGEKRKKLNLKMDEESRIKNLLKYDEKTIKKAVKNSYCYAEALRKLNIQAKAANYKTIQKYIELYNVDISHFKTRSEIQIDRLKNNKNLYNNKNKNLNDYLIKNQKSNVNKIVKKLFYENGIKEKKCELCGTSEEWNGKKLSLILDHIDGNNKNYLLGNLRIICPNCDSTLDTYCSRNVKNRIKKIHSCLCGKIKDRKAKQCIDCHNLQKRNINIPKLEILINETQKLGFCETGRKYNVSDNTIRKWIKKLKEEQN